MTRKLFLQFSPSSQPPALTLRPVAQLLSTQMSHTPPDQQREDVLGRQEKRKGAQGHLEPERQPMYLERRGEQNG